MVKKSKKLIDVLDDGRPSDRILGLAEQIDYERLEADIVAAAPEAKDILDGLEAPEELILTEVEFLRYQLAEASLRAAKAELNILNMQLDSHLEKTDPQGLTKKLEAQIGAAETVLRQAVAQTSNMIEEINSRIGVNVYNYQVDPMTRKLF